MKKIREEKFSGSPDVNASVVSIGLTMFLTIFGAFYTISTGGFITRYGNLMSVYNIVILSKWIREKGILRDGICKYCLK